MKKMLVTGGAGFVGRHLCHALLELGNQVICVDSIAPYTGGICPKKYEGWPLYNPFDYKQFKFIKEDCRDYFHHASDTDFDAAFHLAAMVGGREMIEHNPLAVAEDLAIDSLFWKWAKIAMPQKVVCFSSSAAYPVKFQRREGYKLLTEEMIDFGFDIGMPDMSYGWAKLTHEYLARLAHDKHGIRSVTYRPFSGYGEDQDLAYPFPSICKRALENKGSDSFLVWGTGDQMRDFIHITDCVRGVLTTMDKVDDGGAINLSTGILTSFKEFAHKATSLIGYSPRIQGSSSKPEGVFARGGDTMLQKKLGFTHSIDFETGIKKGLVFIQKKMELS
jgi:GDP-L-fucose synthase